MPPQSIKDWIAQVAQADRGLAALLRGVLTIEKSDGQLRFVWASKFHSTAGGERESKIREHLGSLQDAQISHITIDEYEDPLVQEALGLGAKIKFID
jgi:hypothetical protein